MNHALWIYFSAGYVWTCAWALWQLLRYVFRIRESGGWPEFVHFMRCVHVGMVTRIVAWPYYAWLVAERLVH